MINLDVDIQRFNLDTPENQDYFKSIVSNAVKLHFYELMLQPTSKKYVPQKIDKEKYICDTATQMFMGDFPYPLANNENKEQVEKITKFNNKLKEKDIEKEAKQCAFDCSRNGKGYIYVYNNPNDDFPSFTHIDLNLCEVVYDCKIKPEPIFDFIAVKHISYEEKIRQAFYRIYVHTKDIMVEMESQKFPINDLYTNKKGNYALSYILRDVVNDISTTQVINYVSHSYGNVPLIEFWNNSQMEGDAECVRELIKTYNELQDDRCKNVKDFINTLLLLKNVDVGDAKEQEEFIKMLEKHILAIKGDKADAAYVTNPMDQTQIQSLADDLEKQIHKISRVPDISDDKFSQNASEPILKIKIKPLLDLSKDKELEFTPKIKYMFNLIFNYLKNTKSKFKNNIFELNNDITFQYTHTLPSNDQEMSIIAMNLKNAGLLNPSVILSNFTFVGDVATYINGIDKTEEKNNNSNGMNTHNENLENSIPKDQNQLDNQKNYLQGQK